MIKEIRGLLADKFLYWSFCLYPNKKDKIIIKETMENIFFRR